ncbi:4Fe-4S binding protein [Shewanella sp. JM162201]|uniref:4Fe-4S binding protein n=1 Tax=Shewanella jiangmenensis TaxID=2837387 RepID=A0ABS5V4J0_9GAMM|nr:4Fe-4S dicluster domain-containing protein [Shewanella jiangmenensis]MBT1444848.1 4Fe-4S binding protein [Shewanella jiangmenensis]
MTTNTQYGFYFDSSKCTGCKTCHVACKDRMVGLERPGEDVAANGVSDMKGVIWRRVYEYTGGFWSQNADGSFEQDVFACYSSIGCNHCANPVCVKACPTGAMHKRRQDGLVLVAEELCIGCESCARACPYDAPQLDKGRKVMTKCDGCQDRLQTNEAGELIRKPICVESCPLRALDFDTMENLERRYGKGDAHIAPLPSQSITAPSLIIKANPKSRGGGQVVNGAEV